LRIVSGELKERNSITVDLQDDKIVFQTLGSLRKSPARREEVLTKS